MVKIVQYEAKYRDDMLFCYLLAKDAIGKPTLKDDLLDIEQNYHARGDVFYLAIDENDRVVGMVGTKTVSADEMWLKRLFVKPDLKGQGVGTKLLDAAMKFAVGKDVTAIHTRFANWYHEAAIFYPAKGFVDADHDGQLRHMVKKVK